MAPLDQLLEGEAADQRIGGPDRDGTLPAGIEGADVAKLQTERLARLLGELVTVLHPGGNQGGNALLGASRVDQGQRAFQEEPVDLLPTPHRGEQRLDLTRRSDVP